MRVPPKIGVVIPTYRRENVLIETLVRLLDLDCRPDEILVIDQTLQHEPQTEYALARMEEEGFLRVIRLPQPSITHAMNVGVRESTSDVLLFLDDDIIPGASLIAAHKQAQGESGIVAGQVLQPGEQPLASDCEDGFRFCSNRRRYVAELMGGNFSIRRNVAIRLGGFDENFVRVAYRFEAEFASRALAAGEKILFEPAASIRHLKAQCGGTRSYGEHLTTIRPSHSVGAYYYLLRGKRIQGRLQKILARPFRAIRTRHHLSRPWWIPPTLVAETLGLMWAVALTCRGPRLIDKQ
jgi:GT2 family glycosyltransferase